MVAGSHANPPAAQEVWPHAVLWCHQGCKVGVFQDTLHLPAAPLLLWAVPQYISPPPLFFTTSNPPLSLSPLHYFCPPNRQELLIGFNWPMLRSFQLFCIVSYIVVGPWWNVKSIKLPSVSSEGNLLLLNEALAKHETFFIRCGIFLILEKLKIITYRNLFKKVWV